MQQLQNRAGQALPMLCKQKSAFSLTWHAETSPMDFLGVGTSWLLVTYLSMRSGLALDLTSTHLEVPHPTPDMEPLAPMPLILITTADHKLQLWSFISTSKHTLVINAATSTSLDALNTMPYVNI